MRTTPPAFSLPRAARLSPLAAGLALAFSPCASAIAVFVTNNDPSGAGSLHQAILDSNNACETGVSNIPTITFTGPFTIGVPSSLPTFFCNNNGPYNPTIDGGGLVTATGYDANVTLNGPGFASCGLAYQDNFSYGGTLTVKGMKVQNFSYGSFSVGVCGSVDLQDSLLSGNSIGVHLNSIVSTVSNNVFTDNNIGIRITSSASNTISGNRIGTLNGTAANANGTGIFINGDSFSSISNNLISGNNIGLQIQFDYGGTSVDGNLIGTNAAGTGALPNGTGVFIEYSRNPDLDGNTIAGNSGPGVSINDSQVYLVDNLVGTSSLGNAVGLEAFCSGYIELVGNDFRGNTGDGVTLSGVDTAYLYNNAMSHNGGAGLRVTASGCSSGGYLSAEYSTVHDNTGDGIRLSGSGFQGVLGGSIRGNGGKNIGSLNTVVPVINSVVQNPDESTTVTYTLVGTVGHNYFVQFYSNPALAKPGGDFYLGGTNSTLTTSPETFTITFGGAADAAKGVSAVSVLPDNIAATSTDVTLMNGPTSEFSQMKAASTAPQIVAAPTVLDFGSVEVDTSSASKLSQLRSMGDQPISFYSIADAGCYGGPICYGGAFICSTTCETSTPYANGQACTITARFAPTFTGFQTSSIYLCHNGLNNPTVITLQGDSIPPPPLVLSPTEWDFGDVTVGASSETKVFGLANRFDGNLPVAVGTIGEFDIVSNDCGSVLPAGSNCHIGVAFGPSESGGTTGHLTATIIPSDAAMTAAITAQGFTLGSPTARSILRGNGVIGGQLVLPERVDLGAAIVGGEPISRTAQIVNEGTNPVTLNLLQVSEPFSLTHDCPPVLEPGMACTLTLVFTPPVAGPFTGTLTVMSSDRSAEIPISAMGQTAATALIKLTPVSIGFGSRMIGSASPTQAVTISNIGGADATNFSLASSAIDFFIAGNNCGATLAAGTSCVASVGFRPLGFGTRLGSLLVTSTAVNSPAGANLSGTGCRPFAAASSRFGSAASCSP